MIGLDLELYKLLSDCKGFPKESHDAQTKLLVNLDKPKRLSKTKVLGAIYWVDKDSIMKVKKLQTFSEILVLEPFCQSGPSKKTKCFYDHSEKPDLIGLPRFWGLSVFGKPDKDIRKLGFELTLAPEISLRPLQQKAVTDSLKVLHEWGGSTIIADCGFGKTRLALGLIIQLKRRAILLCNREVLMLQWASVIEDLVPAYRISWIQGSANLEKQMIKISNKSFYGPLQPCDICICSIETLIEGHLPKDFLESFGTVVVDECHHIAASTLVHALPLIPARYIIGLSATPERSDGLEHVIYWLIGPASFVYKRLPSITGLTNQVQIKKITFTEGLQQEKYYFNGQMAFAEMLTFLSQDPKRNLMIVKEIEKILNRQKIIVVSALVAHCSILKDLLYESCPHIKTCLMCGKTVESASAKNTETKIVFATYSLLEEGYDDCDLDTLILATPRSKIQQTVGRIERTKEGKLRPLVIDFVDSFSAYPSMFYKRLQFYKSRGFQITT